MNTDTQVKRILCFGDSNTHGTKPYNSMVGWARWDSKTRWTGVLQNVLGDKYDVIEEGVGGRTTIYDNPHLSFSTNGKTYLQTCLSSAGKIDLLVFMLGTNDCQELFDVDAQKITENIKDIIEILKVRVQNKEVHAVLVLAPPKIKEDIQIALGNTNWTGSSQKSIELAQLLTQEFSGHESEKLFFADMSLLVIPDDIDGIHLSAENHKIFGEYIAEIISNQINT